MQTIRDERNSNILNKDKISNHVNHIKTWGKKKNQSCVPTITFPLGFWSLMMIFFLMVWNHFTLGPALPRG